MPPGGAGIGSAAVAQPAQVRLGIVQERPRQGYVIQVRVRDRRDREAVEAVDAGAGKREQDGRVRRDDELRAALDELEQDRQQSELVLRRERGLRLVQQVQAAWHEPALKQIEERLPVRARVRIAPVAALHVAERGAHRTGGETLGVARTVAVLVVEVEQPLLELLAFDGEPALKSEKVLGPQEEPPVGALRPGE